MTEKTRIEKDILGESELPGATISLDELVVYAVSSLDGQGQEVTFEKLVAKCFELFPNRFGLIGYPQWPDSARVNKAWLRCRSDFHYLAGSVKEGFRLTPMGVRVAERIAGILSGWGARPHRVAPVAKSRRSKEEQVLSEAERSPVFQRYRKQGKEVKFSEFDFCDVLCVTRNSPPRVLRANLALLRDYAKRFGRSALLRFLDLCEERFGNILKDDTLYPSRVADSGKAYSPRTQAHV